MPQSIIENREASQLIYDKLEAGGEVSFHVQGHSMRPFYHHGKTLVTIKKPAGPIKKYDVVLFHTPNLPMILHRVIKVSEKAIYTQGDALFDPEKIPLYALHGVVIKHEYKGQVTFATEVVYRMKIHLWFFIRPIRKFFFLTIHRWRT